MNELFIVGCPRSGTTMLQQALNRHWQIVIPPETKFFYYFYGQPARLGGFAPLEPHGRRRWLPLLAGRFGT